MSDLVFPHTTCFELPLLDIEKQGKFVDLPVAGWGSVSRRSRFRGTWHFYIDDSKFSALWKHPDTILKSKAVFAVEPNFSTHEQMQFPVALYRIYQKRWLARYWQECGMGIFVDLYVADQYKELNLEGVPKGWMSYATHTANARLESLKRQADVASDRAGGDIRFLVYGGTDPVAKYCEDNGFTHVRYARNEARDG